MLNALTPTRWSGALISLSNVLRNKAAEALEAGRKDAAARGAADVSPFFTALADSYTRRAHLSEQARALLDTSTLETSTLETSTPDIK
jgi:hypothetical protein